MARPVKFNGKVYKPVRFGEGIQEGTVEWEINRRNIRKQEREEDRRWAEIQAAREPERESIRARIWKLLCRMFH